MTTPDGEAKVIEWTGPDGFRMRLRVFLADADNKGGLATAETLRAAGYVSIAERDAAVLATAEDVRAELEAVRLELARVDKVLAGVDRDTEATPSESVQKMVLELLTRERQLTAERARAEEAVAQRDRWREDATNQRYAKKTAEEELAAANARIAEYKASEVDWREQLRAANARAARLEEGLRKLWDYPGAQSMIRDQCGTIVHDALRAALSVAPQASTEQVEWDLSGPVGARFQTESHVELLANLSLAKKHVRARYPFARFSRESDRVACEFEGNLVAEILPSPTPAEPQGGPGQAGDRPRLCRKNGACLQPDEHWWPCSQEEHERPVMLSELVEALLDAAFKGDDFRQALRLAADRLEGK